MEIIDNIIKKLNFKKSIKLYIGISLLALIICASTIGYVSRDKIYMGFNYMKASEILKDEGITDKLKSQLDKLASSSKDINNIIILDKDNNIIYKANNNFIGESKKFQLTPYEGDNKYLKDNISSNILYKVVKEENLILNKDYILNGKNIREDMDEEFSYERDFAAKDIYLLNHLNNRSTQDKILIIRTATPIPYAERLIEITGVVLVMILGVYWVGLALWIYQDADKRRLNAALWGLLILVTNIVGLIVYFIYKQNSITCYKCGSLQSKYNPYCSTCGTKINESCDKCNAIVNKYDNYCSKCGNKIR